MRRYELDLCRVLACLMVVMIHLSGSGWHIDPATGAWLKSFIKEKANVTTETVAQEADAKADAE